MTTLIHDINERIEQAMTRLGLDTRFCHTRVVAVPPAGSELVVESSDRDLLDDLRRGIGKEGNESGVQWVALPEAGLPVAQIAVGSVVDVRREPAHTSELRTQVVYGDAVEPLKDEGEWMLVRLDDGYVGWIRNAMNQGLGMQTLAATTQYSAYLLLPVVVLLLISPRRVSLLRRHALVLGSLILAFLATLILAEKPGAGLVHLLPLVPTTMYLLGLLILDMVDDPAAMPGPGVLPRAAVTAVLMTVLLGGVVNVYRAVRLVGWQSDEMPGLAEEVRGIIAQYPDLTIGMACGGENASFRSTWMHPLLVFAGHPLLVETVAVMDCRLTGMDMPPASFDALEDGMVKLWLVPRGQQPFVKRNWYPPHEALFSDRFRNHFETNYTPRGHTEYYDLWWWNGLEGE